jgi:hypothetical protein
MQKAVGTFVIGTIAMRWKRERKAIGTNGCGGSVRHQTEDNRPLPTPHSLLTHSPIHGLMENPMIPIKFPQPGLIFYFFSTFSFPGLYISLPEINYYFI